MDLQFGQIAKNNLQFLLLSGGAKLIRNMPTGQDLLPDQHGVIELKSANKKIIYGSYPLNGFASDPGSGGYAVNIDISGHGLKGALWASATAQYPAGHPIVCVGSFNTTRLTLLSDVSVSGAYALWFVIGSYL